MEGVYKELLDILRAVPETIYEDKSRARFICFIHELAYRTKVTFSGAAVTLSQNNFCGMVVTSNGVKGNSFDTPQLGIRAQVQHIKAYTSTDKLLNERIDPRFRYVAGGCAPYVEWLGQKENPQGKGWAAGEEVWGENTLHPESHYG